TEPPPDPPWVLGMWGASCWYCRKGLRILVPMAQEIGVPFVALHTPEFPDDEAEGFPERVLEEIGLPIGDARRLPPPGRPRLDRAGDDALLAHLPRGRSGSPHDLRARRIRRRSRLDARPLPRRRGGGAARRRP